MKKRFSGFGRSEDVSDFEELASYSIIALMAIAAIIAVVPWVKFFYNFTTF